MKEAAQKQEVVNRCSGNWKQLLRFLQSVDESSALVETSAGNMQIKSGRYHTLLIKNSTVYSCGSSLCGVLGQGPETTQSVSFSRLCFPAPAQVMHMSASHNHAAFVTLSEQCQGLNSVAKDISCGTDVHGQLGHGDTIDRPIGRMKMMFSTLPTLKAVKGKKGNKLNQNGPQEYPDVEIKGTPKHSRRTSREESEMRRPVSFPLHSDAVISKPAIGSHQQRQGGLRGSDVHRPRHHRQVSREEGDMRMIM